MPTKPHNLPKIRKSEMRAESALRRVAVIRSLEEGMEEESINTVVLGGSVYAFSIMSCAVLRRRAREMEESTEDVRSVV